MSVFGSWGRGCLVEYSCCSALDLLDLLCAVGWGLFVLCGDGGGGEVGIATAGWLVPEAQVREGGCYRVLGTHSLYPSQDFGSYYFRLEHHRLSLGRELATISQSTEMLRMRKKNG